MKHITLAAILFATTALSDGPAPAPVDPVVTHPTISDTRRVEPDNTRAPVAPETSKRPVARPEVEPDLSELPS